MSVIPEATFQAIVASFAVSAGADIETAFRIASDLIDEHDLMGNPMPGPIPMPNRSEPRGTGRHHNPPRPLTPC